MYNEARGWDEKGVPSEQKLEELGFSLVVNCYIYMLGGI